jgi:SnoaL-like domain
MNSIRDEIANVLARYAWALSTNDHEAMDTCFHPDADVTFPNGYQAHGRDAVLEELHQRQDRFEPGGWIMIGSTLILAQSDVEASANSFFTTIGGGPEAVVLRSTGWYEDVFVGDQGTWQIRSRIVRPRLHDLAPAPGHA